MRDFQSLDSVSLARAVGARAPTEPTQEREDIVMRTA